MEQNESPNILKLRANFENREAIYIEKGAWRVRVTDIHGSESQRYVAAKVQEIPTAGFPEFLANPKRKSATPACWTIGGGYLTAFSENCWAMGYGGWSLYFAPKLVQGAVDMASRFPSEMKRVERYRDIVRFVQNEATYQENWQKVFPKSDRS